MASSKHSMSSDQRDFLRKKREYLKKNLTVEYVWPKMTTVLSKEDEDLIRAEATPQAKVLKLLDLLPQRGAKAFDVFIKATYEAQAWLGKQLAREAGVNLDEIRSSSDENPGMKDVHQEILRSNLLQFEEKLNVEKMVESLSKDEIITVDNPGLAQAVLAVREEPTRKKQVEKLICEVLPQLGPNAYEAFITILQRNQPHFAHDLQQSINQSHPDAVLEKKSIPETSIAPMAAEPLQCATAPIQCNYSLSTPCADLPDIVFKQLEECLNKPADEILENDWKRFYKVLKFQEGKENVIAGKPNPTRYVMDRWIDRDGKLATVKKLLEALARCEQGGLANKIEKMLGVELMPDIVDGVENMCVTEPKKKKPIRKVQDIPRDLKLQFINRLNGLKEGVLSEVLAVIKMERCYPRDADQFLESIGNEKMRVLFRELRKANQSGITEWMREKFPAGSTGPVKSGDEQKACDMNYGRRLEITKILTANELWEKVASHDDINIKPMDIKLLKMRNSDPAESVLSRWEVSNKSTVGTMYDLLVDCELPDVADHL